MSPLEEQNQSLISNSHSHQLFNSPKYEHRQDHDVVSSNSQCNFLYACENCDGPLAPIAVCLVCKRASIRKCLHCQRDIITGIHLSCDTLISFAKNKLHTRQNQKEVNL
jgi:hypothetical protein